MTNKEKLLKATDELKKGLCGYLDALAECMLIPEAIEYAGEAVKVEVDDKPKTNTKSSKKTAESDKKPAKKRAAEDEDDDVVSGALDREQLDGMKFNDLRKLAKELGVSTKGTRDDVIEAILGADVSAPVDDEEEEDEEPKKKPAKQKKTAEKKPKKSAKKEEPDEDEDDDDIPEEDADELDEIAEQVNEATKGMSTEELAEILSDVGITPKGKRQALIDKIVQAVADGVLSFDDDDDYDEDEDDADDGEDDEEVGVNDLDNPDMTEARADAITKLAESISKKVKSGKLKVSAMKKALLKFYGDDEELSAEIEDMDDEEIEMNYIDMKQMFIDDEGETVDAEEPYEVNGESYCCGQPLEYDEDEEAFVCAVCGNSYSEDE